MMRRAINAAIVFGSFFWFVQAHDAGAATLRVLYRFTGGSTGETPFGRLAMGADGTLYGTTVFGGDGTCSQGACGVVFKVPRHGPESVVYSFKGHNDGGMPYSGVIIDEAGNLYGTTSEGGGKNCSGYGCGTVYRISPDGTESILYSFQGGADGTTPGSDLIADDAGNLYGTTILGGTSAQCGNLGCGTVFELSPDGTKTTLYSLPGGNNSYPSGALLRDDAGNLYGTSAAQETGTVFRVSPDGQGTTLHVFGGAGDGAGPRAGLIRDQLGQWFGTTPAGGSFQRCVGSGCGTVFRMNSDGGETQLYVFQGTRDGSGPLGGVVMDAAGNLYGGTTNQRQSHNCRHAMCGTLYKIAPNGMHSVLYTFKGKKDGASPQGTLILDKSGKHLFGTTTSGGGCQNFICDKGTVFELTLP